MIGSPFSRLQQRLGLLGPDLLPPARTALLLMLLAWLPPALLALAEGNAWNSALGERPFSLDLSVHTRFLIAILMFTILERIAERRVGSLIRQFTDTGLVATEEQGRFHAALQLADRRSSSALAEFVMLVFAYVAALNGVFMQLGLVSSSWLGMQADGTMLLKFAGWWTPLVSLPLFWFLLLRWLWRFVVWTIQLRDVARLQLRLAPTHPDRSGGPGFMGLFPPHLRSPGLRAQLCHRLCGAAGTDVRGYSAGNNGAAVSDLAGAGCSDIRRTAFVFIRPLARLRDRALLEYGKLASTYNRSFESRLLPQGSDAGDVSVIDGISSPADLSAVLETVDSMRVIPAGRETFLPLVIAARPALAGRVLTQESLFEILNTMAQALL